MLYLAGMRLEQFYNPAANPMIYYEEALRRDPTIEGQHGGRHSYAQEGMFEQAEKHLRRAVKRAMWNYTHPRDAEPLYYHGLALRYLGRDKEAATSSMKQPGTTRSARPATTSSRRLRRGTADVPRRCGTSIARSARTPSTSRR